MKAEANARRAFLATGEAITVHPDCWHSEEIHDIFVTVRGDTECDVCGSSIDPAYDVEEL